MKHYQQSHNDAMHQSTKQDNRLMWHRHGLCYLRFFLISLLVVFLMSPMSAQDFKLFYANNVTDVTDFDKITEPNSGLDWRQVTDTDMDGNQAEVYAVHQMLASKDMKGLAQQQQFWRMRDHTLLCFHVEDDNPSKPDMYEVVVEEPVTGQKMVLTVTKYFFVNVPLLVKPRTEYSITVSRVSDPTQSIHFRYNVYGWNDEKLYIFQLDRKRQLTNKDYTMEYVTGYMDENGYMQTDTIELHLKAKSFQSFYVPEGRDLMDVILVGDENKLRINKKRLHPGIDIDDRYERMRLSPTFELDKHQDRELLNFNWLGSGLFEKYDTLYLNLWNHRSQPITSATIHVEQVDSKGMPTHSQEVKYLGYDRKQKCHKVLTMGRPAYVEILARGYYPTVYKYTGAADEETGFVSEERCSVDLTLRPGSWDDEEMVVSSHRFLYLYDERQVVVRNKEDYRLCSILEQELTGRQAADTITYIEDCGNSFPKLLDNKPIDRFAKMEITFSRPKGGTTPSSTLTCTNIDSQVTREAKQDEIIVVNANDFTSFSRDYYFVRYDLIGAILKGEVARLKLTAGDLSLDYFPLLYHSDFDRGQAQEMANKYANDNATGAPPKGSLMSRSLWSASNTSDWWDNPTLAPRKMDDPHAGTEEDDDDGGDAFADAGLDLKLPITLKFNVRPVNIYTGIQIDFLKQIFALNVSLKWNNSDDGSDETSELRKELRADEENDWFGKEDGKVKGNAVGDDHEYDRWVYEEIDDIYNINTNYIGGGLFGGATVTLRTPLTDWKKFQLTEAAGNFGIGYAMAWDLFKSHQKLADLKRILDKASFFSFSLAAAFEASLQLDLGIHSYDSDMTSSMNSSNMGAFIQASLKAKLGATLEMGPGEWATGAKPFFNFKVGLRAGGKLGGYFRAELPFASKIKSSAGLRVLGMVTGDAYASFNLICLHVSARAGFRLSGEKLIPDNDHNPFHKDFPYWIEKPKARALANAYRRLPTPEPGEFGSLLVGDVGMDANPHFLGSGTIVYNNLGKVQDYNDDQVTTLNMNNMQKERLSEEGIAASNHMRSKRGEYEVVVYEQISKKVDNDAISDDNVVSTSVDAMSTSRIHAAFRQGNGQWNTTFVTGGENDDCTDMNPVVTIQDNGSAACIYKHGKISYDPTASANSDDADALDPSENYENYTFTGQLMLRTYDGNKWSQPTPLFDIDDTHSVGKYDLIMRNDTALVAAIVGEGDMERQVLRYASKPMNNDKVTYLDDELNVNDFFMLRVGQNSVVAMTYQPTDSISDIFVKTIDMDGTNDSRMGADLGLRSSKPSKVKIICDRAAENLDDFAVLWMETNNVRSREDGSFALDSMRTVLNASRIHLTTAPQITAPITLGAEIDTVLVMMDYDGFLDDDSISVVYTLADPESGAGIIMRSGKVFCNNFEHEVSYTSLALESSSALPINVKVRNTGTSAIEKVEANINGQIFEIPDSYVAPRRTRNFTVMYPIDDDFNGYISSYVDVTYNNVFKSRVSRRRGAPSNVRHRSPQRTDRVSVGEVDCIVVNHSIENGENTFIVELTDMGRLRPDMGVRVGIYSHPNGGEPLTDVSEVVVPVSEFIQMADKRKCFATVSIGGITEPIQAYINAKVMEPAIAGDCWKPVSNSYLKCNASLVNLFPTDVPTDIRRPKPVLAGSADDAHRVAIGLENGGVVFSNLVPGETVRVFSEDGRAYYSKTATGTTLYVPISRKGVYVLSAGEEVFKFQY